MFTISIGNLPPAATVLIKVTFVSELVVEDGVILFSLPGSVAPWQESAALNQTTQASPEPVEVLSPQSLQPRHKNGNKCAPGPYTKTCVPTRQSCVCVKVPGPQSNGAQEIPQKQHSPSVSACPWGVHDRPIHQNVRRDEAVVCVKFHGALMNRPRKIPQKFLKTVPTGIAKHKKKTRSWAL